MKSWPAPVVPSVPGDPRPVRVFDTASGGLVTLKPGPVARLYVCGITPYDATHMGHAATYVTFDVLGRALRQAGHEVRYAQNITDVDDPLLERAHRDGVDWTALATKEIQLFRDDMTALRVIPPDDYVGVVESVELIADRVQDLVTSGHAYGVPATGEDVAADGALDYYLDLGQVPQFGEVSHWDAGHMMSVFADRGGDPDRQGKRSPFDPLLWRAERTGEPAWPAGDLGRGRPGWHIECTAIALDRLGGGFDVQGGGSDLVFPHHEMSAAQTRALTGGPFAGAYVHQAMVGLDGEKMSKSKGNLVLVSRLRAEGVDPMAVRLVLLDQHYRTDWEWTQRLLDRATERLARWREAVARADAPHAPDAAPLVEAVRAALADDLDTPRALAAVDAWAAETLREEADPATGAPPAPSAWSASSVSPASSASSGELVRLAVDAWLGVAL